MPPEARELTAAGASAFATYYFEVISSAYTAADVETLKRLSHEECATCNNVIDHVQSVAESGGAFEGGEVFVHSAEAGTPDSSGIALVSVVYSQTPLTEYGPNGEVASEGSGETEEVVAVYLQHDGAVWRVFEISDG